VKCALIYLGGSGLVNLELSLWGHKWLSLALLVLVFLAQVWRWSVQDDEHARQD
jgi:hypothetical protein